MGPLNLESPQKKHSWPYQEWPYQAISYMPWKRTPIYPRVYITTLQPIAIAEKIAMQLMAIASPHYDFPTGAPPFGSPFPVPPSPKSSSPGTPFKEPQGLSLTVLSELCLLVVSAVHWGMCVLNAMPGVVPAFLEFLVLWSVMLKVVVWVVMWGSWECEFKYHTIQWTIPVPYRIPSLTIGRTIRASGHRLE